MHLDPTLLKRFLYAVVVIDRETLEILDANEAASSRYGYPHARLLGMKISELRVPDERHLVAGITDDMAAGPAISGPFRHRTARGEELATEVVSIPGEFRGRPSIAAILVDATERISAQTRAGLIFDRIPMAAWIHDCDTFEILAVNDRAVELYGYSREELLSMTLEQLRPDRNREAVVQLFRRHPAGDIERVYRHQRKDGTIIAVEATSTPIPYGKRNARLGAGRDITQELASERALERAIASLEEAQELTHLGSWQHDFHAGETLLSRELRRILGLGDDSEPAAGAMDDYVHRDDAERVREGIESAPHGELFTLEHRIVRTDGTERWVSTRGRVQRDPDGALASATGTVLDITEQRRRDEDLRFLAYHDPLTGLPNRQSMPGILDRAVSNGYAAVFFIDFDSFKEINDTFGHDVGDSLLQQIAVRLQSVPAIEACRWGGDEFVVVAGLRPTQSHEDVLFQLRTALAASFEHDDQTFFITPSIGIALYPEHGDTAQDLIRNADTAMYEAKRIKNMTALFRSSMADAARERLYVQNGLHEALQSDHLRVAFQPIVDAATGEATAAEALVRWDDPIRGMQMPDAFLEVAERTGLILPIGDWVVSEACRTLSVLRDRGISIPLAVNVAGAQIETGHIVESILKWTAFYGLPPQRLCIEIAERGIIRNLDRAASVMTKLRQIGVSIALDDFGSGYSPLSYLKNLPLDVMKIDKSLVGGLDRSERDRQFLVAVLQLAKASGLSVVAEGVERAEEVAVLRSLGCETLQGFYFSRPLGTAEFVEYLGHSKR